MPIQSTAVNRTFTVRVSAKLPTGEVDASFGGLMTLTLNPNASPAQLMNLVGAGPFQSIARNGIATFPQMYMTATGQRFTLGATATDFVKTVSNEFDVVASAPFVPPSSGICHAWVSNRLYAIDTETGAVVETKNFNPRNAPVMLFNSPAILRTGYSSPPTLLQRNEVVDEDGNLLADLMADPTFASWYDASGGFAGLNGPTVHNLGFIYYRLGIDEPRAAVAHFDGSVSYHIFEPPEERSPIFARRGYYFRPLGVFQVNGGLRGYDLAPAGATTHLYMGMRNIGLEEYQWWGTTSWVHGSYPPRIIAAKERAWIIDQGNLQLRQFEWPNFDIGDATAPTFPAPPVIATLPSLPIHACPTADGVYLNFNTVLSREYFVDGSFRDLPGVATIPGVNSPGAALGYNSQDRYDPVDPL